MINFMENLPLYAMDSCYRVASTEVGQHLFTLSDRLLWIVEVLHFYSAPSAQQSEARKSSKYFYEYRRPLPWILFLPALLTFRVLRFFATTFLWMYNSDVLDAMTIVYWMMSVRQKLEYIKAEGSRTLRARDRQALKTTTWLMRTVLGVWSWSISTAFTLMHKILFGLTSYRNYFDTRLAQKMAKRPQARPTSGSQSNTSQMLDKYAEEDDSPENDPDFMVKSSDLISETDEDADKDDEEDEEHNSETEDATQVKENGKNESEKQNDNDIHNAENERNNSYQENAEGYHY